MKRENTSPKSDSVAFDQSRRSFILGLLALTFAPSRAKAKGFLGSPVRENHLRPPGAVPEEIFAAKCIRCGRCAEICPYRSIEILDIRHGVHAGTPLINVLKIPCYLCMKCVEVCPTGTLKPISMEETRMGLAVITKRRCITWRGEALCRTCYNVCPFKEKAIKLDQLRPVIIEEACTGCGLCAHGCPLTPKAINIEPIYAFSKGKNA